MSFQYLDYADIVDNAIGGGLVENPKLSQVSSSLLSALCLTGRIRSLWQSNLVPISDEEYDDILDIIRDAEAELMSSYSIGAIIPSLVDMDSQASLLRLNGQTVAQSDYPELALICPVAWLVGLSIILPNLDTTSIHGGYGNVGGIVGANTHQLTVNELATHTHIQNPHSHTEIIPSITPSGAVPVPPTPNVLIGIPSLTGVATATNLNAGANFPHNNVPRSIEVIYYLVSR